MLCVTLLIISLDTTILNVALPSIVRDLHASSSQLQWIVDAYAIVFAGLLLTLGATGDRFGRKWVFMIGLVVFAAGSAFAAFSGSPDRLTAARAVMGAGAAALMPCTLSILTNTFPDDRERATAIGIWSGTAGLGVAIGPVLGGFLLDRYWWGSVFLINVPIAAIGLVATIFLVPNSKNPSAQRSDVTGSLLTISGFSLLLWGIIEAPNRTWTSPVILGAFAGAALLLVSFVLWERHSAHPMLPLRFFGNRRYSVAIASLALVLFALLGMFFLLTQYLQFFLGFTPLKTGLAIAPLAIVLLVAAPTSVLVVRKIGTKPVVAVGMLLIATGAGLLAGTSVHDTYRDAFPFIAVLGLGVGLSLAPLTESIMGAVPPMEAGVGSATSDTSMQVGGALGVAILGTALNLRFRDAVAPVLAHKPVPPHVSSLIEGSLGGALAVATHLPGQVGQPLESAARHGFVTGMDLGFAIAAVVVGIAAVAVALLLPSRAKPGGATEPPLRQPGRRPRGRGGGGRPTPWHGIPVRRGRRRQAA